MPRQALIPSRHPLSLKAGFGRLAQTAPHAKHLVCASQARPPSSHPTPPSPLQSFRPPGPLRTPHTTPHRRWQAPVDAGGGGALRRCSSDELVSTMEDVDCVALVLHADTSTRPKPFVSTDPQWHPSIPPPIRLHPPTPAKGSGVHQPIATKQARTKPHRNQDTSKHRPLAVAHQREGAVWRPSPCGFWAPGTPETKSPSAEADFQPRKVLPPARGAVQTSFGDRCMSYLLPGDRRCWFSGYDTKTVPCVPPISHRPCLPR